MTSKDLENLYAEISELSTEILGSLATTACLPLDMIKTYHQWYPQSLTVCQSEEDIVGFYVLVPLTDLDVAAIEQEIYKSGFDLAKGHQVLRPKWSSASEFYLMGIYAKSGQSLKLKNSLDGKLSALKARKIYAKGTTEKGKLWMKRKGFQPVSATTPISFLAL